METNKIEIFNYLNLVNTRIGKFYKLSGFNPLPDNFVFSKQIIEERLFLNQMQTNIVFPEFLYKDKNCFKKHLKICVSNAKKLLKIEEAKKNMSQDFYQKFCTFLSITEKVVGFVIKDLNNYNFDETEAYQEIYNIDPIMFDVLQEQLFQENLDFSKILNGFEKKYKLSYAEKLKLINKKELINTKKLTKNAFENLVIKQHYKQKNNIKTASKNAVKQAKNPQKIENMTERQKINTSKGKEKE